MKNKSISLISILMVLALPGISQKLGKTGFDKYVFGSSPSDYKDLTLEIDEGDTKLYTAPNSSAVNGVEFNSVNVTFCKNKLTAVALSTKNATASNFFKLLKDSYGEPKKSIPAKGHYEWEDSKLHLTFEKNQKSQDASVSFYSVELYNAMKKTK